MNNTHPIHAVGRDLRKKLRARFPDTRICIEPAPRYSPPTIFVVWRNGPPRGEVAAFLTDHANREDYRLCFDHEFMCRQCGRGHLTGSDDLPRACSEPNPDDWPWTRI